MADAQCIPRNTPQEFYNRILSEYRARVLRGRPVLDCDPMHPMSATYAGILYQQQGDFEKRIKAAALIKDMCCDQLIEFADCIGCPLKPAQSARGFVIVTGKAGAAIPGSISFTAESIEGSTLYNIDPLVPAPTHLSDNGDGTGTATVFIRAALPGAAGNIDGHTELFTTAAVTKVDSSALASGGGITGGTDEETCEELRARLIDQRRNAATSGNQAWFRRTLLKYPGVTRVCSESCAGTGRCGGAYQSHYVFMDSTYQDGTPPAAVLRTIEDWLYGTPQGEGKGEAMVGLMGQLLSPKICTANVKIFALSKINPTTQDSIRSAFDDYFRQRECVSGTICKSDLFAVVTSVLPSDCFRDVELESDCIEPINGGRDYRLDTGTFPRLGGVTYLT